MTTPTFTPTDIVKFAAAKDAVNISAAFDELIGQKVVDAIQARKQHVASMMFNDQQQDEVEASAEDTTETDSEPVEAASDDTAVGSEEQAEQETEESDEDAQVPN